MSRLVILAASIIEIPCGKKTDRQTNKLIDATEDPTQVTSVGVGKYYSCRSFVMPLKRSSILA